MNARQRRVHARAIAREAARQHAAREDVVLASFGRPIMLSEAVSQITEPSDPVWVEVCLSGVYLGHPNAERLDWGPPLFQKLIDNLHRHPSYRAGADGVGCVDIIAWDYEHESEIAKMTRKFPEHGLPSRAWTRELQVRPGADGNPSFWALTRFMPIPLKQIRAKEYQWCSIAVDPHFIDPVSGEDQGPTVTSIALTNDPFIQGMVPLAATRKSATLQQTIDQWGPAESVQEAVIGLQQIFELDSESTPQQVIEQIRKLRALVDAGSVPEYLGIDNVLDRIRRLLEMPLLTPPADILGGAEAAVNQLISGGSTADSSATSTIEGTEAMSANTLNVALATRWNCQNDDASILLAAAKMDDKVKCANDALSAFDQLKGLLGGDDVASVVANCTKMVADAKQLGPVLEALTAAQSALKGGAEADAEKEAQLVAASMAKGDSALEAKFKPVILAARRGCFDETTGIVDEKKLAKFREDYPLDEEHKALLTRRVVAGPNGTQLGGAATGYQTQVITQSTGTAGGAGPKDPQVQKIVDAINTQDGPNAYAKANNLLCSRSPSHKALPLHEQHRVAGDFVRTVMAGNVPAGFTL